MVSHNVDVPSDLSGIYDDKFTDFFKARIDIDIKR